MDYGIWITLVSPGKQALRRLNIILTQRGLPLLKQGGVRSGTQDIHEIDWKGHDPKELRTFARTYLEIMKNALKSDFDMARAYVIDYHLHESIYEAQIEKPFIKVVTDILGE